MANESPQAHVPRPQIELLTVDEASRLLRVGRHKVYEMVRAGDIPAIRLGRSLRIPAGSLVRMVDAASLPRDEW